MSRLSESRMPCRGRGSAGMVIWLGVDRRSQSFMRIGDLAVVARILGQSDWHC